METLVSICIPAYNSGDTIAGTIDSVLRQTYQNLEVVVVDDHSTDGTAAVVEGLAARDARVKFYQNEQNLGMSGNWNRCLSLCSGAYVKLICADDKIFPDALEKEVAAMEQNPSVNMVESDTRLEDIHGQSRGTFYRYHKKGLVDGKKLAKRSLMLNNFFGAPVNNLLRRSALERVGGFDAEFEYILDFDLWVRMACSGDVYIIHEPLNSFCVRNGSNTGVVMQGKRDVYVEEHRRLVEKHARAGVLRISRFECWLSVAIRRMRNVAIGVYMRLFAK